MTFTYYLYTDEILSKYCITPKTSPPAETLQRNAHFSQHRRMAITLSQHNWPQIELRPARPA
jgi:hypothetical protein